MRDEPKRWQHKWARPILCRRQLHITQCRHVGFSALWPLETLTYPSTPVQRPPAILSYVYALSRKIKVDRGRRIPPEREEVMEETCLTDAYSADGGARGTRSECAVRSSIREKKRTVFMSTCILIRFRNINKYNLNFDRKRIVRQEILL